jgi:hypothetical protein
MRKILTVAGILFLGLAFTFAFAQPAQTDAVLEQNVTVHVPEVTVFHVTEGADWAVDLSSETYVRGYCYNLPMAVYHSYSDDMAQLFEEILMTDNSVDNNSSVGSLTGAQSYPAMWTPDPDVAGDPGKGYLICVRLRTDVEKLIQVYTTADRDPEVEFWVALEPKVAGTDLDGFGGFYLGIIKKEAVVKKLNAPGVDPMSFFTRAASGVLQRIGSKVPPTGTGWKDFKVVEGRVFDGSEKVKKVDNVVTPYKHTVKIAVVKKL